MVTVGCIVDCPCPSNQQMAYAQIFPYCLRLPGNSVVVIIIHTTFPCCSSLCQRHFSTEQAVIMPTSIIPFEANTPSNSLMCASDMFFLALCVSSVFCLISVHSSSSDQALSQSSLYLNLIGTPWAHYADAVQESQTGSRRGSSNCIVRSSRPQYDTPLGCVLAKLLFSSLLNSFSFSSLRASECPPRDFCKSLLFSTAGLIQGQQGWIKTANLIKRCLHLLLSERIREHVTARILFCRLGWRCLDS